MNPKDIRLFRDKNLVFLATIMKDGSPQVSPVWADYEDEHILINTAEGRIKHKNILRDPRVAISVVDHTDSFDMISVRGKVVKIVSDYDYKHADKLSKKYLNLGRYPFRRENEKRIILKIKPERVFVLPELQVNQK